jgi:hypothetical protein
VLIETQSGGRWWDRTSDGAKRQGPGGQFPKSAVTETTQQFYIDLGMDMTIQVVYVRLHVCLSEVVSNTHKIRK